MNVVEMICYGLALAGILLTLIGRILLLTEASSISMGWVWAIRMLPLADVMFLSRFWDSAKKGAFTSLAGLVLLMPLGGKALWDEKHPKPVDTKATFGRLDGDRKNALYSDIKAEHDERVQAKQRKLAQLNAHMSAWYQSMQERRGGLETATPQEVAAFNEEAAAYSALHEVSKKETAALQTLLGRNLRGWNDISDDEYAAYLRKQDEHRRMPNIKTAMRGIHSEEQSEE
jgi:Skp family chaperone for outer membrane proteins